MKHINTWLKLYHNIYDSPKMIQIETMKNGDTIQGIFLRLMCYACELGNEGVFSIVVNGGTKPFTPQMFARRFHKSTKVLENSLIILENLNMINKNECAVIIVGWAEHQNKEQTAERMTSKREYMKDYNEKKKEKKQSYAELMPSTKDFKYTLDVDVREEKIKIKDKELSVLPPTIDPISKPNEVEDRFETFWKAYPKKEGKGDVKKWFAKKKPSGELLATMLNAIKEQKQSEKWISGYVPMPMTWLNQGRWEDEMNSKSSNIDPQAEMERVKREEMAKILDEEVARVVANRPQPIEPTKDEPLEKLDLNLTGILAKVKM